MQFCLEEFCFMAKRLNWLLAQGAWLLCLLLYRVWQMLPGYCNESVATGQTNQALSPSAGFIGNIQTGSSAERFVVPIASKWDLTAQVTSPEMGESCLWAPTAGTDGLWTPQHTSRNISLSAAPGWILAICSSVTNGRVTSLLPRAENIWVRQHHSLQSRSGCCEEMGDLEPALCDVSAVWLFNDFLERK